MDNFPGLFQDGDLGNLDLGAESYNRSQGPQAVPVQEMDMVNYNQSTFTNLGNPGNPRPNAPPSGIPVQGTPQKMTLASHAQPGQQNITNYPNQNFAYNANTPNQQMVGYSSPQYRQQYQGQNMYGQQPNANLGDWNNSAPYAQGGYQQPQPQFSQAPINSYQNQTVNPTNNMQQNFPVNTHHNLAPNYQGGSPNMAFQNTSQPQYQNFDQQRAPGPNSPNMANFNKGGAIAGQPNQQYPVMQNPAQQYHMSQYPQSPIQMRPQHPNQISPAQMMCGPGAQGDLALANSMPNGTPYRAPFPQVSPQMPNHNQGSPHHQSSPLPRSISPHTNANLMNSPISSPASHPVSVSISPNAGVGSIQHLENMVKPNGAGGGVHLNSPNSISTHQTHSSNMFVNSANIHGAIGQRGHISPNINNQINPGVAISQPQNQWQQGINKPQGFVTNSNQVANSPSSSVNVNHESLVSSVSDKSVCVSDKSNVVLANGQVSNMNLNKRSAPGNIVSESVNNNPNSIPLVNGTSSNNEPKIGVHNVPQNVPLTSLSSFGATNPNVSSTSLLLSTINTPTATHSHGSVKPDGKTLVRENGLVSTTSVFSEVPNAATSEAVSENSHVPDSGNTLTLYSASHPEGQSTFVQQNFMLVEPSVIDQSNENNSSRLSNVSNTDEKNQLGVSQVSVASALGSTVTAPPSQPVTKGKKSTGGRRQTASSRKSNSKVGNNKNTQIGNQSKNGATQISQDNAQSLDTPNQATVSTSQLSQAPVPVSSSVSTFVPINDPKGIIPAQLNISKDISKCHREIQQLMRGQQNPEVKQKITVLESKLAQLEEQQKKQQQQFLENIAMFSGQPNSESGDKKGKKRAPPKPRTPKEPKTPKTPRPKKEPKPKEPKEPKPKREPKPKTPKVPKEPKPKKEKTPKTPKEPKPPREKKKSPPKRIRKKLIKETEVSDGTTTEGAPAAEGSLVGPDGTALLHTPVDASKLASTPKSSKSDKKSKAKGMFALKKKTKLSATAKMKKKQAGSESDYSESEGGISHQPRAVEGFEDDENKRRSGRLQTAAASRKKYVDELELNLSDDDDDDAAKKDENAYEDPFANGSSQSYVMVNTTEEDTMPVQMILAMRRGEREEHDADDENGEEKTVSPESSAKSKSKPGKKLEVDEYYVKYKGLSYLHCSWGTEDELLKGDKRIGGKIKRYRQKRAASQNIMDFLEEEPFNPDYVEVDRVLDVMDYAEGEETKTHCLIKWKSLPYDESTWESIDDCDAEKVEAFHRHREPPSKAESKVKKAPKPDEWKELSASPVYKNNNQLREYQLEGLNWLTFSYYNGHNCILADEMGLGKTIQSISFIQAIYDYGIRGPYLIIAPLSTIPNWQREFEGWTNLNVIVYHGSQSSRNMILEYEMFYKNENKEKIPNVFKFNVLITTFEVIIADNVELKEIHWKICIIDEAHRLKNRNCKLLEGLRTMNLEHRVLLSGTPLQNNVNELFSLLNFLEPHQFACQDTFLQEFGNLQTEEQVKKLQALLKPMMLRRMKEDVEKSLAPKQETIIEVELTNIQKKYYRAILERNFDFLIKGATYTNVPSLMNTMMELRKCCLHPYLLNGAEDGIQLDYKEAHPDTLDVYHSALIQSSGKMVLVDKLLPRLKANGHRVLVFSQMVKLLDIIEDYLIYKKYPYERLDGRIRGNLRQAAIDRFCKPDSDRFVFLLCTKAGGLGINLTAADTVIIYDSDWNPQNDLQAQARCHRIGQQKSVKIYRLLCRNTYEREMFDKASLKLGLDKAVLQSMNTEVKAAAGNSLGLSKKEVEDLLKKGAYGALMEDDNQGDKFCEEDIDQILSRRATVVTLESEKGSTFSKASFSSSDTRNDIDLDDPDFWKKWAKKADIDLESADKQLIMDEPRKRSAIRRYGHDEAVLDCSDLDTSGSDSVAEQEQLDDMTVEPGGRRTRRRRKGNKSTGTTPGGSKSSRGSKSSKSGRWGADDEPADDEEVKYGLWHRNECFKVEKGLLTFGWGRWREIMRHGEFRSAWTEDHVLDCARMVLLFCIRYYRGDDKIKGFIFDLIAPSTDGQSRMHPNHVGLSAPVPRGRKGKKKLREAKIVATHIEGADWAKDEKFDSEKHLDQGYSRHLVRHANKVLLRVRLLFYIKQEIIGDFAAQVDAGTHANEAPIYPPPTELLPRPWWDNEADRNLLVGVYKHGYERYNVMRNDPTLCYLLRCGPPDAAALSAEMANTGNVDLADNDDKEAKADESDSNPGPGSPAPSSATNKSEDDKKEPIVPVVDPAIASSNPDMPSALLPFPSTSDLNSRVRRLVTSYQRNNRKMEMRKEASMRGFDHFMADKMMRRERMAEYMRDRDLRKADYSQRRWSNREQSEFYRTISTFGVEYIRKEKRYDWSKFRSLSRLEKRVDENLTEYFRAFMAMCKRQCGIRLTDQENAKIMEIGVDRLPEDRARRVLERVDMLNRLRNDVLPHPELHKALEAALPSKDMPGWWIPGKHDLDLIRGVARHGLGRTDYYILYDPDLCFREILRRHTAGEPLITAEEKAELIRKYYKEDQPEGGAVPTPASDEDSKETKTSDDKMEGTIPEKSADLEKTKDPNPEQSDEHPKEKEAEEEAKATPVSASPDLKQEDAKQDGVDSKNDVEMKEEDEKQDGVDSKNVVEMKEEDEKQDGVDGKDDVEMKEESDSVETKGEVKQETKNGNDDDAVKMEFDESDKCASHETKTEPESVSEEGAVDSTKEKVETEPKIESDENATDEKVKPEIKKEQEEMDVSDVQEKKQDPKESESDEKKIDASDRPQIKENAVEIPEIKNTDDPPSEKETAATSSDKTTSVVENKAKSEESVKVPKAMPGLKGIPTPPLLSLQQMDEAMSKIDPIVASVDQTGLNEPTVAQLLAQSAANPIKWPKDRYLQIRLEHLMYAVEHKTWPVPIDYQTVDYEFGGSKCDTPPSAPSTPTHHAQEIFLMEAERKRRRQMEEVERAHLQAMLHPNLHQNLGLSKVQAALGLNPNSFAPNLRSLMEASEHDKKNQQILSDSHTHALRQLQALQGSLDLTVKPVSSQALELGGVQLVTRRGPGRPRLDENILKGASGDKRRHCDSPQDGRKRRKLDDIVLGLTSKTGKFPDFSDIRDPHTLSLLKSPSVSIITSKDRTNVTPSLNVPKLSSSISITPTNFNKINAEARRAAGSSAAAKAFAHSDKSDSSGLKPGLVKSSDLPPGINLPPGIELYRPAADSTKVDKWLEQHQDLLGDLKSGSRESKRRKLDVSSLDWTKFSGDERVALVNASTGHKISCNEGPKLKYLLQWMMEHPGYEIDPRWLESNKDKFSSDASELQSRLLGHDKKTSRRQASPSASKLTADHKKIQGLLDLKNPLTLAALSGIDPKLLTNVDPKKLPAIDSKLAVALDPKLLLGSLDPKLLGIDPKHPAFDPKMLSAMGIDPKILGIDTGKHQETKVERKPSPAPSPCSSTKSNESKPSTSQTIDPNILGGLDPKLLSSLDPKLLAGLDAKSFGVDPKVLAALGGGIDPKLLTSLSGMDPTMMMMAGFGGLQNMAGMGLANPFLAGLSGFNVPNVTSASTSSSSKDNQRQAAAIAALAANQANLFAGMFGGAAAAGLMYPPLGMGGLNPFQLQQMTAAQSSALLNGFGVPSSTSQATQRSQSTYSKRQNEKERLRQEAEREREIVAARKEKMKETLKGVLSKDDRNSSKQDKSEKLARVDPRTTVQTHEIFLANHLSQLGNLGQLDLSVRPATSSSSSKQPQKTEADRSTPDSESASKAREAATTPPTEEKKPSEEPEEKEAAPATATTDSEHNAEDEAKNDS